MPDLQINFEGPFTFTDGERSLFHSTYAKSEGVYLWTIQQNVDASHLIHYVGETKTFAKRHREHLIHILSMDYGIFDPTDAATGQCTILWSGLWRDKSPEGPGRLISEYMKLKDAVPQYLASLSIFFAPTALEQGLRKHVEGCIGWNLRTKPPESKVLYPDDNRIVIKQKKDNGHILVGSVAAIRGLDASIPY